MDMDSLKYVNDKYGHADGDVYITTVADCLKAIPGENIACRLGGDEFMLLMPDTTYDQAHKKALTMQKQLSESEQLEGKDYDYSVSYGIVEVNETTTDSSAAILGRADELMYEHKRARKKSRDTIATSMEEKKTA
jgi:diguanylate cyclase (GGDEF)-like protein